MPVSHAAQDPADAPGVPHYSAATTYDWRTHVCLRTEINAGDFLSLDVTSANFDNIAGVLPECRRRISRLGVGKPAATAVEVTCTKLRTTRNGRLPSAESREERRLPIQVHTSSSGACLPPIARAPLEVVVRTGCFESLEDVKSNQSATARRWRGRHERSSTRSWCLRARISKCSAARADQRTEGQNTEMTIAITD
jgi:hypothetical protein